MLTSTPEISIVVPVYNEEEVIGLFYKHMTETMGKNRIAYEIVFVDDGSTDRTFSILRELKERKPAPIKVVKFARNFGHQLAITAGLRHAQGKAVVVTDADLQDPPEVILQFIEKWKQGYEVVYGVRTDRRGETFLKKFTADLFYKIMRRLANIDIPENAGDFYLLDRKVVDIMNALEERHRFLRGLIMWVGFNHIAVGYQRQARSAGVTKFGFWRMLKFSFDAATSFSFAPLRMIMGLGFLFSTAAFIGILYILYLKLFTAKTIVGWTSIMVVVLFSSGVQLIAVGLIGEYLARIGDDVKKRPLYTVEKVL